MLNYLAKRNIDAEILRHVAMSFAMRLTGAFSGFLLSIVVARKLGAEESGYFFLAFAIVSFLAAVSRIGFDNTVLRFTSQALTVDEPEIVRSVLVAALRVVVPLTFFVALVMFFFSGAISEIVFDKPALAPVMANAAPAVVGIAVSILISMSLQGHKRVLASVFVKLVSVNMLALVLLSILQFENASAAIGALSIASIVTAAIAGFLLWPNLKGSVGTPLTLRQLSDSFLPLWVAMILTQLLSWSGQFIAAAWIDTAELAQLAVAQRTAALVSFLLLAVNMVTAPRFASLHRIGDTEGLYTLARTSMMMTIFLSLPVFAMLLFMPQFVMGLFGNDFRGGSHLLQILCIGQIVNVGTGSVTMLLNMTGREKDMRNILLLIVPITIGATFILTLIYGASGTAIATALAIGSQNLLALRMVKVRLGFNVLSVRKYFNSGQK